MTTASDDRIDRALGCLVGLALGDALGTTLEFEARDSYPHLTDMVGGGPFRLKPGEWTDDTSMALCLAETLLTHGKVEPRDLMDRFRRWYRQGYNSVTGRCFDIGNTVREAIHSYERSGDPLAGSAEPDTAGNGSIMRLAPVALYRWKDLESAADEAVLQSRTTHAAPEVLDAVRLMAHLLCRLVQSGRWTDVLAEPRPAFVAARVQALSELAWRGRDRSEIRSGGYVIETLEAALWAVDATKSVEEALLLAVNLGGDADTVGAVAGQLAGARYGLSGIPDRWLAKLAWRERIESLGRQLLGMA